MMFGRKTVCLLLAFCLLCTGVACARNEKDVSNYDNVVTLNTLDKFYCNGTMLEANVRELTVSGNDAAVRIRITNIGDDPISELRAQVRFYDGAGNELYKAELLETFDPPLYKDESVSVGAYCSGADVDLITKVTVAA